MKNKKLLLFIPLMLLTSGMTIQSNIDFSGNKSPSFNHIKRVNYSDGLGDIHTFPETNHNNLLKSSDVVTDVVENGYIRFNVTDYFNNYCDQERGMLFITSAGVDRANYDSGLEFGFVSLSSLTAQVTTNETYSLIQPGEFDLNGINYHYFYFEDLSISEFTNQDYQVIDVNYNYESGKNEYYLFALYNKAYNNINPSAFLEGKTDIQGPLISGSNVNYFTNVENPISVDSIKSKLTATDDCDGDVTSSIRIVEDKYTGNERVLGSHTIKFEASDTSGNKSNLIVTINVKDVNSPVIVGPDTVTYSYDDIISEDSFLLKYSSSDNIDSNLRLTLSGDNIFEKTNKLGNYNVVINCHDQSGNEATKSVTVVIEDKKAPVIVGPDTITKRNSVILTTEEIISQYTANDVYDGACGVYVIEDNYTGHGDKKGTYTIKLGSKDKSQNETTKTLQIDVMDDISPVWYVDQTLIYVDSSVTLTQKDIINLMIQTGEITNNVSFVQITANEYEATPNEPGKYQVKAVVKYSNGNQLETTKTIRVLEEKEGTTIQKKTFWDKIGDFFKKIGDFFVNKIFKPIGKFFKSIWNKLFE